jgi:hypothetical protein
MQGDTKIELEIRACDNAIEHEISYFMSADPGLVRVKSKMEPATFNWMNAMSAAVLFIVAIFVIVFAAISINRVNGYVKDYDGVDLVPADDWSASDDPNSGLNRIKGIQTYFVASLVATLILAALVVFVLYKLFGAPAAAVYGIFLFAALIYGFVSVYYLGGLGKNRLASDNGDIGNGTEVDVNHTYLSTTNMSLAFVIIHALLASALGIYFLLKRKNEKTDPLSEPITGKGRVTVDPACRTEAGRCLPGAGRAYWTKFDGRC